jgi:acetyl-CoA carboxylase carboxyl transferase subunit alpha
MVEHYLDFEKPVYELEKRIEDLRALSDGSSAVDLSDEIERLSRKAERIRRDLYSKLTRWQRTLIARHPQRPYTLDYIDMLMTGFIELHGDRGFADDRSIVGGPARLDGRAVMVIGHQKGRNTKEKIARNFGMSQPEGYRKALRLMKTAERFGLPVITLVDTPGAFPGIEAEERGQGEAIARNLIEMADLEVPIVTVVTGEGGSGGALALAVSNRVMMMENATYSVISPEGCAAILWKNQGNAKEAAEAMKLTAVDSLEFGIIDEIIPEPMGGAHRDHPAAAAALGDAVRRRLTELSPLSGPELVADRYRKFRAIGVFAEGEAGR